MEIEVNDRRHISLKYDGGDLVVSYDNERAESQSVFFYLRDAQQHFGGAASVAMTPEQLHHLREVLDAFDDRLKAELGATPASNSRDFGLDGGSYAGNLSDDQRAMIAER